MDRFSTLNAQEYDYLLEMCSVERGICPVASSTMNELFL